MSVERLVALIPTELLHQSGKVFYSGRKAFSRPAPIYILGLNPGGCPEAGRNDTVASHTQWLMQEADADWSAYRDESWEGRVPGTYGMAPRILHLLERLHLSPGEVPASNLVFKRSRRESHIAGEFEKLADLCWPFHAHVIDQLQPKVVVCLGKRVGNYVHRRVGSYAPAAAFVENNKRRWRSQAYVAEGQPTLVVATHPSIANWRSPDTDPSQLVEEARASG